MQIGEVAERTGLSLRTIRYYEEVGLVVPATRSQGGFRLYVEADVDRLRVIKRMKPLDFSLESMREMLGIIDRLASGRRIGRTERVRLHHVLRGYVDAVHQRRAALHGQLAATEEFAATLTGHLETLCPSGPAPSATAPENAGRS
ncbi:MAG: MerR family transcriptional regulator [Dactylosporangium sp.]|nr:MerR family transcriptional regulator [Dactylosporangium sp.]NNJ59364.1 MerR family transcriptional regulator [Dactylosporangium sp.]